MENPYNGPSATMVMRNMVLVKKLAIRWHAGQNCPNWPMKPNMIMAPLLLCPICLIGQLILCPQIKVLIVNNSIGSSAPKPKYHFFARSLSD